jgi:hypothetical protein
MQFKFAQNHGGERNVQINTAQNVFNISSKLENNLQLIPTLDRIFEMVTSEGSIRSGS